jgi:hypothetical protein
VLIAKILSFQCQLHCTTCFTINWRLISGLPILSQIPVAEYWVGSQATHKVSVDTLEQKCLAIMAPLLALVSPSRDLLRREASSSSGICDSDRRLVSCTSIRPPVESVADALRWGPEQKNILFLGGTERQRKSVCPLLPRLQSLSCAGRYSRQKCSYSNLLFVEVYVYDI